MTDEAGPGVSILIPYGSDGPWRDRLCDWVTRRWAALLPDAEIVFGASDEPFSRARARNNAFARATGDLLVVADADTVPLAEQIRAAVAIVRSTRTWVLPYDSHGYYNLTREATERILARPPADPVPAPANPEDWDHRIESWAGLLVMTRAAYETVGGYSEQFVGWGYEDNAMRLALDTLWAPHTRLPGHCIHLWHPAPETACFGQPSIRDNQRLYHRYQLAAGQPDAMRKLIAR